MDYVHICNPKTKVKNLKKKIELSQLITLVWRVGGKEPCTEMYYNVKKKKKLVMKLTFEKRG